MSTAILEILGCLPDFFCHICEGKKTFLDKTRKSINDCHICLPLDLRQNTPKPTKEAPYSFSIITNRQLLYPTPVKLNHGETLFRRQTGIYVSGFTGRMCFFNHFLQFYSFSSGKTKHRSHVVLCRPQPM